MLFGKKFNRAMEWLRNRNRDKYDDDGKIDYDNKGKMQKIEKNDLLAMFISAAIVFVPIIIVILGLFVLIAYWFT
ncbi:MAG TPA: hypothetical protein GXZ90_07830 [Clostridiales bacterium]|nr:hypothetical protein [Clostridiales bacterium]